MHAGGSPERVAETTSGAVIVPVVTNTELSGEPGRSWQREPRPFCSGMLRAPSPPHRTAENPEIMDKNSDKCKGGGRAVHEVFANTRGLILGSRKLPQLQKNLRSYDISYQLNIILCWQTLHKSSDLSRAETKFFFHPQ